MRSVLIGTFIVSHLALAQVGTPFYANKNPQPGALDNIQILPYNGPKGNEITDVDARGILEPIMSPFVTMFDVMQQNAKAHAYADKVVKEREASPFSNSKGLFDLLEKLQRPTTTPTPAPSFMEQMFQPYLEPWQRQLDTISKEMAGITILPPTTTPTPATTTQRSLLERSLGMFFPSFTPEAPPPTTPTPREIRRSPARLFDPEVLERVFDAFNYNKHRSKRSSDSESSRVRRQSPALPELNFVKMPDFFSPDGLRELFDLKPKTDQAKEAATPPPTTQSYHPHTTPAYPIDGVPTLFPNLEEFFGGKKLDVQKQQKSSEVDSEKSSRRRHEAKKDYPFTSPAPGLAPDFPPLFPTLSPPSAPSKESPNLMDFFNPLKPNPLLQELNKPVTLDNPFTANPLMGMFTTKKPIPSLQPPSATPLPTIKQNHYEPQFKLQDPFYNPLFPNRKSKIFDLLAGGEAARLLG